MRVSIAQSKRLKFLYQSGWAWWPPRVAMAGFIIYLVLYGFDWSIPATCALFFPISFLGEGLGRWRLAKIRKRLRSDDAITVSLDENGVDVVSTNSHSHSTWAAWAVPVVYPNGVLMKMSRLSGIWLPDNALIEGSPEDVRKLLSENVRESAPQNKPEVSK